MAHFAQIDKDNIVIQVLVTDNNDVNGDEGYQWLIDNLGGTWIKTSYNGTIRKNFAGVGFYYDEVLDAFIPPKPYSSWTLDEESVVWTPPIERPDSELSYDWDEQSQSWVEFDSNLWIEIS